MILNEDDCEPVDEDGDDYSDDCDPWCHICGDGFEEYEDDEDDEEGD